MEASCKGGVGGEQRGEGRVRQPVESGLRNKPVHAATVLYGPKSQKQTHWLHQPGVLVGSPLRSYDHRPDHRELSGLR